MSAQSVVKLFFPCCALVLCLFALQPVHAQGRIGVIAVEAQYTNAEDIRTTAEMLGYNAVLIKEDVLSGPGGLADFSCVILTYRHSDLYKHEYEALADYVRRGGTLFIIHSAITRLAENPDNRLERPWSWLRGEGPLREVTGVERGSTGSAEKFRVVERTPHTEGLPEEFEYQTTPPYDVRNPHRWTEVMELDAVEAETLIEVEAYYNGEETRTKAFLTVNSYGDGKCVWIGCRTDFLISRYRESNILRIFNNVLAASAK